MHILCIPGHISCILGDPGGRYAYKGKRYTYSGRRYAYRYAYAGSAANIQTMTARTSPNGIS